MIRRYSPDLRGSRGTGPGKLRQCLAQDLAQDLALALGGRSKHRRAGVVVKRPAGQELAGEPRRQLDVGQVLLGFKPHTPAS